jgi:hypothetical protein
MSVFLAPPFQTKLRGMYVRHQCSTEEYNLLLGGSTV